QLDALLAKLKYAPPTDPGRQSVQYRATAHLQLRLDRYEDCLAAVEKAECAQNEPDPYILFLKAIALHKLNRHDEASAVFAAAESLSDSKLPQPIEQSLDFLNPDQLYQQIVLRREARALIFPSEGSA